MGNTPEENCSSFVGGGRETRISHLVWVLLVLASFDDSGMSLTMEQVVTQLQQEILTLKANVADPTGTVEAVRAINEIARAQVRKESTSLIDVKGPGKPKEFIGKGEVLSRCDQGVRGVVGVVS